MRNYRKDIDGLRAIAVIAVLFFHFELLPNGFFGVDVFFVISGFLITQIIYKEAEIGQFSILNFYIRRVRRILPLVMVICTFTLLAGYFFMLPDDFEKVGQSVLATNFFSNNILLWLLSNNYWNNVNEYNPLIHTWSLGIEEQFYFLFPLLFLFFKGHKFKFILPLIFTLTLISLLLFIFQSDLSKKFYLIQYRFFELSIGGLGGVLTKNRKIPSAYKTIPLLFILLMLFFDLPLSEDVTLLLVTFATLVLLLPSQNNVFIKFILENKVVQYIGKYSFSIYMWHQVILALAKYCFFQEIRAQQIVIIVFLIALLSIVSYNLIEVPFRNKKLISLKILLLFTGSFFIVTSGIAFYINKIKGVVRDVPELGISQKNRYSDNFYMSYCDRIFNLNRPFSTASKLKILVVGDSFARDWSNVILESNMSAMVEISYVVVPVNCADLEQRVDQANYIFLCTKRVPADGPKGLMFILNKYHADTTKIYCVGPKKFGQNMGIFYNAPKNKVFCSQRCMPDEVTLRDNLSFSKAWGKKFIDIIDVLNDSSRTLPVFTDEQRGRDSNPRYVAVYTLSRRAPSTTRTPLCILKDCKNSFSALSTEYFFGIGGGEGGYLFYGGIFYFGQLSV
jgi:peptidoglycan/LPS O-acetylase OafA/YrhL